MTTLLSASSVDFARSVKNSSAVLIVLILINKEHPGHSTTADEIRDIIEMDVRTITNHLRSLSARNLALFDGHGYVLIEENAMILGNEALVLSPVTSQALELPQAQALEIPAQVSSVPSSVDVSADAHTVRALVVEDSLILIKKDSTTTTYLDAHAAQKLTAAQVFQASNVLFGESVFLVAGISTARALSVFAHVHDLQNARTPARLAFSMLKNEKEARQEYIDNPWRYFPEAYLETLHVLRLRCTACDAQDIYSTRSAWEAHKEQSHPLMAICPTCHARFVDNERMLEHFEQVHEPQPILCADESVEIDVNGLSARQAWKSVKKQMQSIVPKADFETWVESSEAVRFDGNVLQVGTRNAFSRDWLEKKLTDRARAAVSVVMGRDIEVTFVVADTDAE